MKETKQRFLSEQGFTNLQEGIRTYVEAGFDGLPRDSQRQILEKIVPAVVLKNINQLEIRLASPAYFVTTEEKSCVLLRDGGRGEKKNYVQQTLEPQVGEPLTEDIRQQRETLRVANNFLYVQPNIL